MYLLKCFTRKVRESITGDYYNFANIKIETSRLPATLTVPIRKNIFSGLIFRY